MTKNQIDYQRHLEERRSNLASEFLRNQELQETARSNREKERQGVVSLGETERSHRATEGLQRYATDTQSAHYTRADSVSASKLAEDMRANLVAEEQRWRNVYDQAAYWGNLINNQNSDRELKADLASKQRDLDKLLKELELGQRDVESVRRMVTDIIDSIVGAAKVASAAAAGGG